MAVIRTLIKAVVSLTLTIVFVKADNSYHKFLLEKASPILENCGDLIIFHKNSDSDGEMANMLKVLLNYSSSQRNHNVLALINNPFIANFLKMTSHSTCIFASPIDPLAFLGSFYENTYRFDNGSLSTFSEAPSPVYTPTLVIFWPTTLPKITKGSIYRLILKGKYPQLLKHFRPDANIYFVFEKSRPALSSWDSYTGIWEVVSYGSEIQKSPIMIQPVDLNTLFQKVKRRNDFQGTRINAVAAEDDKTRPEVDWAEEQGQIRFTKGSSYSILQDLRDILNFTDGHLLADWLGQYPNETLKGKTIDHFNSGRADIMIGHTVMLPHRARQVQYLQPTYLNALKVYLQQPYASAVRDIYFAPFSLDLWLSLLATWVITVGIMTVFQMVTYNYNIGDEGDDAYREISFGEILLWSVGLACQQGWYKHPKTASSKIIFFVGAICGLILHISYTASIVSVLSVENIPIKNLDEFFASKLPMYASGESSALKYFVEKLFEVRPQLKMSTVNQFISTADGVKQLFMHPMSFLSYSHLFNLECRMQNISDYEWCQKISGFSITSSLQHSGMCLPKGSPLREIFDYRLIQLIERGFLDRYVSIFNKDSSITCAKKTSRYRDMLGINDTFTAYAILVSGHGLSLIILLIEYTLCGKGYKRIRRICLRQPHYLK